MRLLLLLHRLLTPAEAPQLPPALRRRPVMLAEVEEAIAGLTHRGFVMDAAIGPPDVLGQAELERYKRNLEFFSYLTRPPALSL